MSKSGSEGGNALRRERSAASERDILQRTEVLEPVHISQPRVAVESDVLQSVEGFERGEVAQRGGRCRFSAPSDSADERLRGIDQTLRSSGCARMPRYPAKSLLNNAFQFVRISSTGSVYSTLRPSAFACESGAKRLSPPPAPRQRCTDEDDEPAVDAPFAARQWCVSGVSAAFCIVSDVCQTCVRSVSDVCQKCVRSVSG